MTSNGPVGYHISCRKTSLPPRKSTRIVKGWIKEGRFANRSEAFRAGVFALKEKFESEAFDPDYVTIVRELDRHPGGAGEPTEDDLAQISTLARKSRKRR